jgi:hypothetical protein
MGDQVPGESFPRCKTIGFHVALKSSPFAGVVASVTEEMVAAQGRFLQECGMGVEQRLLFEPATDRINTVGA